MRQERKKPKKQPMNNMNVFNTSHPWSETVTPKPSLTSMCLLLWQLDSTSIFSSPFNFRALICVPGSFIKEFVISVNEFLMLHLLSPRETVTSVSRSTRCFGHNRKKVLFAWRDWQLEFSLACVAGGIVTSARIKAESC